MTSRDFCYWLQGFFEVSQPANGTVVISPWQAEKIKKHLAMVFAHEIDPSAGPPKHQAFLDHLHDDPNTQGSSGIARC